MCGGDWKSGWVRLTFGKLPCKLDKGKRPCRWVVFQSGEVRRSARRLSLALLHPLPGVLPRAVAVGDAVRGDLLVLVLSTVG